MHSKVANFHLKGYVTDDQIANLDKEARSLKQGTLLPTIYAQKLWSRTSTCGFVYDKRTLKAIFVEDTQASIHSTIGHW